MHNAVVMMMRLYMCIVLYKEVVGYSFGGASTLLYEEKAFIYQEKKTERSQPFEKGNQLNMKLVDLINLVLAYLDSGIITVLMEFKFFFSLCCCWGAFFINLEIIFSLIQNHFYFGKLLQVIFYLQIDNFSC